MTLALSSPSSLTLSATAPGFIGFTLHAMVAPVETGAARLLEPPVVTANNNSSVLRRAVVAVMTREGKANLFHGWARGRRGI